MIRALLLASILAGCADPPAALSNNPSTQERTQTMTTEPSNPLFDPAPAAQLVALALDIAASEAPADHARLREAMTSEDWLLRLNSADEYARADPEDLGMFEILTALAANPAPQATATLAAIAASPATLEHDMRQELMLRAVGTINPLPAALAPFLATQVTPEAANLGLAIPLLIGNGSPVAISAVETAFLNPGFEEEEFEVWLRDPVLRHRQDPPLLDALLRLLENGRLADATRLQVYEVLFDYQPDSWYPPDSDLPEPPEPSSATPPARNLLRQIGALLDRDPAAGADLKRKAAETIASL